MAEFMVRKKKRERFEEANKKPCILVFGPGSEQGSGVATFNNILLSSTRLQEKYQMEHLDTIRAEKDMGLGNQLSVRNLSYLVQHLYQFIGIAIRLRPKILHLPVTSGLAFWKSALLILLGTTFHMKTVAHLHGGRFDQFYRKQNPFIRRIIGWVFYKADTVIALSSHWKRFLFEEVRPDLQVEVVSNTIDLLFAREIEQGIDVSQRKEKRILFLGSLGHRKGVFDILEAIPLVWDKHPDACFFFAGEEEKRGEKAQIDQVCRKNQLNDNIQFLGMVTGQAKIELFKKSMVYILPSYGENLPYSLLEAMAIGLPVVTTPVGAIPEIIENGYNGFLIEPGDYDSLARRIVQILDEPALREKMSQANIKTIKDGFLPDTVMIKFDSLYTRLIALE
jgi:glycosyltransferase involved in cell wall biosynthesis